MKPLINPIGTDDGQFHGGNQLTGAKGTMVTPDWLNDYQDATRSIQNEIISILTAANITPDVAQVSQLLTAIRLVFRSEFVFTPTASGWVYQMPQGFCLQFGVVSLTTKSTGADGIYENTVSVTFPVAFTSLHAVIPVAQDISGDGQLEIAWTNIGAESWLNGFTLFGSCKTASQVMKCHWLAVGKIS